MLGGLFSLAQMRSQAKSYKGMAGVARTNAAATRAQGRAQAESIRETARKNQEIEAQIMRGAQENAYSQVETLRAAQGASGFTAEGSGVEKRIAAQQALNQQIANMAMSASISMSNSWQQSVDVTRQAEARAVVYEGQAAAYAAASKGIRQGMLMAAAGGLAGMGLGLLSAEAENKDLFKKVYQHDAEGNVIKDDKGNLLLNEGYTADYYDEHKKSLGLNAMLGADTGVGIGGLINPYTAALTGDANARKNNWQSLFAITNGNMPYNPQSSQNIFGSSL